MRAQRRTQIWTVAIAAAAMVFVATVSAKQFQQLWRLQGELERIQRAMVDNSADRELAHLNRDIAVLERLIGRPGAHIPARPELGDFVQELTRRADECGVAPSEVRPGEPAAVDRVTVLPVTFRVQGPGKAVFELIRGIETMQRMTRFEHIAARPAAKQAGQVQVEVCVSVFYRES